MNEGQGDEKKETRHLHNCPEAGVCIQYMCMYMYVCRIMADQRSDANRCCGWVGFLLFVYFFFKMFWSGALRRSSDWLPPLTALHQYSWHSTVVIESLSRYSRLCARPNSVNHVKYAGDGSSRYPPAIKSRWNPDEIHQLHKNFLICDEQGPDLYAFIEFIGFIGPDDINYMYWTLSDNMCYILVIKY